MKTIFTKDEHWKQFAEFCKWEIASGGPDPQIAMVGEMSKQVDLEEKRWRAGCYIAVYNVPFGEVLWTHWSYERMKKESHLLLKWLEENWAKIVTRIERKTVRRPEWMHEYLMSYYRFMCHGELQRAIDNTAKMSLQYRYTHFWDLTISSIRRYGRYVALKLLESYIRFGDVPMIAPDIRPKDGWSPRTTLGELYPKYREQMNSNNNEYNEVVNRLSEDTIVRLWEEYTLDVDYFQLQVLLCEYRESYHSKKQYPGRSLDSELGYWHKANNLWDMSTDMFTARKALFPAVHLGELQGWHGTRKDCGTVLTNYGYTWSDLKYDYFSSLLNMAKPVKRL